MSTLLVIAKAPIPGAVKTRLTPPCTPEQAAALAAAALADTLEAMAASTADRRVVVLDGPEPPGIPAGFEVIPQRGDGLGERLAAAFADTGGGGFLVAMDTPQVTPALLEGALATLRDVGTDAVIGPTPDGGYWGIGFAGAGTGAFDGVPMSAPDTYDAQLARLHELGLCTEVIEPLLDVDTVADARAVARVAPHTRFAAALRESGHAGDQREPMPEAPA